MAILFLMFRSCTAVLFVFGFCFFCSFCFAIVWSGFPLHLASWRPIGLCTGPPSALLLRPITQKDGIITMLELMEHVACQASVWIDLATAKRRLEKKKLQLFEKRCNDIDDG